MGWGSGGEIYEEVAKAFKEEFGETKVMKQSNVLEVLIKMLEQGDCDVLDESVGISIASDLALKKRGYHIPGPKCRDVNDYTACSCGFEY